MQLCKQNLKILKYFRKFLWEVSAQFTEEDTKAYKWQSKKFLIQRLMNS